MLIIRHWSSTNGSGMHHAAAACALAERRLGHDSELVDVSLPDTWASAEGADIHVLHTHFPDEMRARITKRYRLIFVPHGTPEHVMEASVENFTRPGYAPADAWMLLRHWLQTADAVVTFWERHQVFYQSMVPIERTIHFAPMGVDLEFWRGGTQVGKYAGHPSVWMSENQHRIKWALDVLMAWGDRYDVAQQCPAARLHATYLVYPLHRFFVDMANSNGAAYRSYLSPAVYVHEDLRNIWTGLDYLLSPVRYGDHNCLFMQAAATGLKTISYAGNPYADFWIPEGDQREMARALAAIFNGQVAARTDKLPVPDLKDMGEAMIRIYERTLAADSPTDLDTRPRAEMLAMFAPPSDGTTTDAAPNVPFVPPANWPARTREQFKDYVPPNLAATNGAHA